MFPIPRPGGPKGRHGRGKDRIYTTEQRDAVSLEGKRSQHTPRRAETADPRPHRTVPFPGVRQRRTRLMFKTSKKY